MFSDLKNSGLRYFKNNFSDGYKQDAFDVLLGVSTLETRLPDFNEKIPQELILVKYSLLIQGSCNFSVLFFSCFYFICSTQYVFFFKGFSIFFIFLFRNGSSHISFLLHNQMDFL